MSRFQASFLQVDITPDYQVELIGCDRIDRQSHGILHKLFAQVLVFKNDSDIFCLIAIDSLGLTTERSNKLRTEVGMKLNTTAAHVMLNFSHTHSAPEPTPFALNGDRYFGYMCEQIVQTVEKTKETFAPCQAGWALTKTNLGENRREGCTIIDDRLGALKISEAKSKTPIAVILRISAHANVLMQENNMISSDYFGIAREKLHEYFSCPVMMLQGAAGNIKPFGVHKIFGGNVSDLDTIVDILEESVIGLTFNMQEISDIQMLSKEIEYISDVPTVTEARKIAAASGLESLSWLSECEKLRQAGITEQKQSGEIQFLKINEGCLCGVPEEIFCEISLIAAENTHNPLLFLNGYTNGCTGYLPTAEEWEKGGYETLYSYLSYYQFHGHVMPFRANTAEQIIKLVSSSWIELSII